MSPMSASRLGLTGVPGWLTEALLDDVHSKPGEGQSEIRALVHPGLIEAARSLGKRFPLLTSIYSFDLGSADVSPTILEGLDVLVHSAALIHVRRTQDWYSINTEGTLRLARVAKQSGVRRFVFISSNAAAGRSRSRDHLLTEDDCPQPLSHYGKSKLLAEQGLLQLHDPERFDVVILRPSMFYGPPVPPRHVDIYRRILSGRMPIVGSGDYSRSITYIENLVQATRLAITHPAAGGETFFVVDQPVYTTRMICDAMASALGARIRYLRLPGLVGPVSYAADRCLSAVGLYVPELHLVGESHWHVGISGKKLQRQLGYAPKVELADGMKRAIEWCRTQGKL